MMRSKIQQCPRISHVILQYNMEHWHLDWICKMPNWSSDFTESILATGDRRLKAGELLSEYEDPDLNEGYAVVNGLDLDINSPGLIRFCYE